MFACCGIKVLHLVPHLLCVCRLITDVADIMRLAGHMDECLSVGGDCVARPSVAGTRSEVKLTAVLVERKNLHQK